MNPPANSTSSGCWRGARKTTRWLIAPAAVALVAWAMVQSAAQPKLAGRVQNYSIPIPNEQGGKSFIRGSDARPLPGGQVALESMVIEHSRGETRDLTIKAPHCVFHPRENLAVSDGELEVQTADGRFSIRGRGFRWDLKSSQLTISNAVETLLRKQSLLADVQPSAPASNLKPVFPTLAATEAPPEGWILVSSDRFEFRSDQAIYQGRVRGRESEGQLDSENLTVRFAEGGGRAEEIAATGNVRITQGAARGRGDKAIYVIRPDQELVTLAGNASWEDGDRGGTAGQITHDRKRNILTAEGQAHMKFPRAAATGGGLSLTTAAVRTPNASPGIIEIFAERIAAELPENNGPIRSVLAEENVRILSAGEGSEATCESATYSGESGLLQLEGNPVWTAGGRTVRGQTLALDLVRQSFSAGPGAHLMIPIASLSQSSSLAAHRSLAQPVSAATNLFLEVFASQMDYQTNLLSFRSEVRASLLESESVRGHLTCDSLEIIFADEVERASARGNVRIRQVPAVTPDGLTLGRDIECADLTLYFAPAARLVRAVLEGDVTARQTQTRADFAQPTLVTIKSDLVDARFSGTNQLESVLAEKNVRVTQTGLRGESSGRSDKAIYNGASNSLELLGHPTATLPEGRITEAQALVWDLNTARLTARGRFRSEWEAPPGATNRPGLLRARSPSQP